MSNPPPNSKEFLDLQAKWDKKLAKNGFTDIEQRDGRLKIHETTRFYNMSEIRKESSEQYYRLASFFYHEHNFINEKQKLVWFYHSNGITIRDIVKKLRKQGYKAHRSTIHELIQKLLKLMYERYK